MLLFEFVSEGLEVMDVVFEITLSRLVNHFLALGKNYLFDTLKVYSGQKIGRTYKFSESEGLEDEKVKPLGKEFEWVGVGDDGIHSHYLDLSDCDEICQ